jgi:hypothetical protein
LDGVSFCARFREARISGLLSDTNLVEFGWVEIAISLAEYVPHRKYQRVVAVPFLATSGRILVHAQGFFCLVAAQWIIDNDANASEAQQAIDLFFEAKCGPLERSSVLVIDAELSPPTPLLETVAVEGA